MANDGGKLAKREEDLTNLVSSMGSEANEAWVDRRQPKLIGSGLSRTVFKNASANLVRVVGSALIALFLPFLLVRMLPPKVYGAWALLLQVTMYVGLFDFGLQTAVARFVAHADELRNSKQRDGIASTAVVLLAVACVVGLCMIGVMAWQLPHLFKDMPGRLHIQAQVALLLMGGSFAIGLPFSVIHAIFMGLQQNEIPVTVVLANRLTMAVLTVAVVYRHWGLAAMGGAVAVANVLFYGLTYFAWRRWAPQVRIQTSLASMTYAKEIGTYSAALMVWSLGMLMVSGLDLTIVGAFQYSATAYYSVALTVTTCVAQAQTAMFAALLAPSAALAARGEGQKLGSLLISSTRYGMLTLLAMILPLIVAGKDILKLWVGTDYALHSTAFMEVLVCAYGIRLFGVPYSTLLLGSGQHGKVILSPLVEGVINLVSSLIGAYLWGAIGVAVGTVIGSLVGIGLHLFYNMPRTTAIAVNRVALLNEGLLKPLVCATPFGLLLLYRMVTPRMSFASLSITFVGATVIAGCLFWHYGLIASERQRLEALLRPS
jgi:O-antigen/teichoic acid export membrane protein